MSKRAKARSVETVASEEVRRLVAETVAAGCILSITEGVARIVAAVPRSSLSKRQIGDELMMAAVAAGVAVEFGAPTRAIEKDDLAA